MDFRFVGGAFASLYLKLFNAKKWISLLQKRGRCFLNHKKKIWTNLQSHALTMLQLISKCIDAWDEIFFSRNHCPITQLLTANIPYYFQLARALKFISFLQRTTFFLFVIFHHFSLFLVLFCMVNWLNFLIYKCGSCSHYY